MASRPLHKESQTFLELRAKNPNVKPYSECTPAEARAAHDAVFLAARHLCEAFEGTRKELVVPSPHVKGKAADHRLMK
jgi:hypothetical protein